MYSPGLQGVQSAHTASCVLLPPRRRYWPGLHGVKGAQELPFQYPDSQ